MKRCVAPVLALAALCGTSAALAQGYVGVSLGQARVNLDCSGTTTCEKTDTAAKLFGGFMFAPNWGVEAAYYDQGKLRQTATDPSLGNVSADWRGNGFGLFVVGAMPVDAWSVFGKLGLANSKVKLEATSSTLGSAADSERHTGFAWGLGGEFRFARNWAGRLEFEQIRLKFLDEKRNANLWTLAALYRF